MISPVFRQSLTCFFGLYVCAVGVVRGAEKLDISKLPPPAQLSVDFARDIQPIFEAHCVKCHGAEKQKGGWRVDVKEVALTDGDNYAPNIHPGKSAESPMIHFVAGLDPEMKMPAKGDPLTAAEIGLLRAWIDQGAVWPEIVAQANPLDWWSLKPLRRPAVPVIEGVSNPIDAFIRAKLAEKKLIPSPEADRRTLIRRLYYDLTGLPPKPEDIDTFVADPDPKAYEKLVDQLLASPQYGERWARHWLDVVRYGETHGYDKDQPRNNAWPYRDYVIRAFNEDKPYGRFVQEQIAGDVLFPSTEDGIEALGFIAAGPWDLIGHAEVPETKTDGKIARNLDRDDMVSNTMNTFNSLTVQCARCHNHKFDKYITQEDYYSLQAVFAALDRADKKYDLDPVLGRQRGELAARIKTLKTQREQLRNTAVAAAGAPLAELEKRLAALQKPTPGKVLKADAYGYHSQISPRQDTVKWVQMDLGKSIALSKIVLHPCKDDYNQIGEGFGFPVRFKVEVADDPEFATGVTMIGDQTQTDLLNPRLNAVAFPVNGQAVRYVRVTATRLAPRKDDYIFALAELSAIDVTAQNVALGAAVTALDSIEAPPRWRKTNLTDAYFPGANLAGEPDEVAKLTAERDRMVDSALTSENREALATAGRDLAVAEKGIAALPPARTVYAGTVHTGAGAFVGTGANGGQPRVIQVLHRGDVNSPRQMVEAGTVPIMADEPSRFALAPDAPEGERRAALAHWLTDPRNPLTWRSIVNRVWQYHFGHGLVDSPNDFGHMGQLPTHPELLDWLAVEFRDGGQSIKHMHRLIVTSATYRQASCTGNEAKAAESIDGDNRFLWRMNRRRLEAEAVRDSVLSVAGQLDLTMGGPSFRDFVVEQPAHSPHYEYRLHDADDPKSHRRSIYRWIVRSQPQPFLTTLDCADPSMSVEKRNESLSALQALALMNNPLMVVMAKHFAERLEREATGIDAQITRGFQLGLGRAPRPEEQREMSAYARQFGLPNTCRLIFNLNEFVFAD